MNMKYKTQSVFILLTLGFSTSLFSQVQSTPPPRQVIGCAGGYSLLPALSVSYSVGETVIQTLGPNGINLTQGFQQPSSNITLGLSITAASTNLTCNDADNGTISITILSGSAPFTYSWTPSVSGTNTL